MGTDECVGPRATSPAPAEGPLKIKVSYSPDAPGNEGRHPARPHPLPRPCKSRPRHPG